MSEQDAEKLARRAEGDAAPNESWWDLRRRLDGVEEENRVLYRRSEIYRKAWHEAQAETAARDAVIAKAKRVLPTSVADAYAVLDAAPESVLAERDAEKWDEGEEHGALSVTEGRVYDNPYRNGATHE